MKKLMQVSLMLVAALVFACGGDSTPDTDVVGDTPIGDQGDTKTDSVDTPDTPDDKEEPETKEDLVDNGEVETTPEGECSPATVDTDCAELCTDLDPCQECLCNVTIGGGTCEIANKENGASCDSGHECSINNTCEDGVCGGGKEICQCRETTDCQIHEDGDFCNGTLVCNKSQFPYQCEIDEESIVECDDSQDTTCSFSSCEPETGDCVMTPVEDGEPCETDHCVLEAECQAGECVALRHLDCDDDNPCTDDRCDPELGCVRDFNDAPCDLGDKCTLNDFCHLGVCTAGEAKDCSDGNVCNGEETCDSEVGCRSGEPLECDDGIACTEDSCDPKLGCVFTWIPTAIEGPLGDPSCENGIDDNCDGKIDDEDPGCLFHVERLDPPAGPETASGIVTLIGDSLDMVVEVRFEGLEDNPVVAFTVISPQEIKLELAPMPAGEYDVTILSDVLEFTLEKAYLATGVISADDAVGEFWLEVNDFNREFLGKVGDTTPYYGVNARVEGITDQPVLDPDDPIVDSIIAEVGYGPMTDLPTNSTTWKWVPAAHESIMGDIFRYSTDLTPDKGGIYLVMARFSLDGGQSYVYAGPDGIFDPLNPPSVPVVVLLGEAQPGDVIFNEVMWGGTEADSNEKWIELRNTTSEPFDLSGWKISNAGFPYGSDFAFDDDLRIVHDVIIQPYGLFLIQQFEQDESSVASPINIIAQATGIVPNRLVLVESATAPKTYELMDADGVVIDAFKLTGRVGVKGYGNPFRQSASMERNAVPGDGTLDSSWHPATAAEGWKRDPWQDEDLGTPGRPNSDIAGNNDVEACLEIYEDLVYSACEAISAENGRCVMIPFGDGEPCDDGLFCTVGETCNDGVCGNGEPRDCSDEGIEAPCTIDWCDEEAQECVHEWDPDALEGGGGHETCSDGIDNNCDGLTDEEDPLCGMFLDSATPLVVSMWGGSEIEITGRNLDLVTQIVFGDIPAEFELVDVNTIVMTTPAMDGGPGDYKIVALADGVSTELESLIRVIGYADGIEAAIVDPTVSISINLGQTTPEIKARVEVEGLTDTDPLGDPGILISEVGYGPNPSEPLHDAGWTWRPVQAADCFECGPFFLYVTTFNDLPLGDYFVTYRFSLDGGYTYQFAHIGQPTSGPFDIDAALELFVIEEP